jgi:hypothetical protein
MHEKSLHILSQSENGYVSQCVCCEEFNFTYKNVLLVFDEESMMRFFDWVVSYRYSKDNYQPLPHGRNRIYAGPHNNLFLVYNDEEINEIERLFAEVSVILEARKIVAMRS